MTIGDNEGTQFVVIPDKAALTVNLYHFPNCVRVFDNIVRIY